MNSLVVLLLSLAGLVWILETIAFALGYTAYSLVVLTLRLIHKRRR